MNTYSVSFHGHAGINGLMGSNSAIELNIESDKCAEFECFKCGHEDTYLYHDLNCTVRCVSCDGDIVVEENR